MISTVYLSLRKVTPRCSSVLVNPFETEPTNFNTFNGKANMLLKAFLDSKVAEVELQSRV